MASEAIPAKKKLPWLKLGIVAIVLAVGAVAVLRGVDVKAGSERAMTFVRAQGPVTFFVALAVLPAVGAPASPFTLTAGSAFGQQLGIGWVVVLTVAAITFNMALTYALARWVLRKWLERWLQRFGYKLPKLETGDLTDLTILLRVTPGTPFPVQNYLLGVAGVPFGRYILVSTVVMGIYTAALVLFGDALLHGKGKLAALAIILLVIAAVAAHWARNHYGKKKQRAEEG